ncbi:hypothetical protein [Chryseobacterium sp.]|uniref:hypothetical protein n=1 Tax=Chryseobacterium sp. TaxID=1871047 RepID=UPI00289F95AE|nr:hypothetical protein [Chryseobacterium sp.]
MNTLQQQTKSYSFRRKVSFGQYSLEIRFSNDKTVASKAFCVFFERDFNENNESFKIRKTYAFELKKIADRNRLITYSRKQTLKKV